MYKVEATSFFHKPSSFTRLKPLSLQHGYRSWWALQVAGVHCRCNSNQAIPHSVFQFIHHESSCSNLPFVIPFSDLFKHQIHNYPIFHFIQLKSIIIPFSISLNSNP